MGSIDTETIAHGLTQGRASQLDTGLISLSRQLTRDATFPWDLRLILHRIAETARTTFAANLCAVFAVNPITRDFIEKPAVVGDGIDLRPFRSLTPRPAGLTVYVLEHGIQVFEDLDDPRTPPELLRGDLLRHSRLGSLAGIPLRTPRRKKPLAVVYVGFQEKGAIRESDRDRLSLFAEPASSVLQSTWLLRRYRELTKIATEINEKVQDPDPSKLFDRLQERAARILDIGCCLLMGIFAPQTGTVDYFVRFSKKSKYFLGVPLEGPAQSVMERQRPLLINHRSREKSPRLYPLTGLPKLPPSECLIFVPMVSEGVSLGVLSIQHPTPDAYDEEDHQILTLLANHVSLALTNRRLNSNLRALNRVGQNLTKELSSNKVLTHVARWIRETTCADLTVLYPFIEADSSFNNPFRSGRLLDRKQKSLPVARPGDITSLAIQRRKPLFAKDSTKIYSALGGSDQRKVGNFVEREKVKSTAVLPLWVDRDRVGVLFLNYRMPQEFDEASKFLIIGLANYAAIAIKNSREFSDITQRAIDELKLINRIDRQISKPLEMKDVAQAILEITVGHIKADEASIMFYEDHTNRLVTMAATGANKEISLLQTIPLDGDAGLTRWVFLKKEPLLVNDIYRRTEWRDKHVTVTPKVQSVLDYPIINDQGDCLGVINLERYSAEGFEIDQMRFLEILAGQVVLAIGKAQAFESQKQLARERQVILDIHKIITTELSEDRVVQLILEQSLKLTNAEAGCLYVYDKEANALKLAYEIMEQGELAPKYISVSGGIAGWVASNKRVFNEDIRLPPWADLYEPFLPNAKSELAAPLLAGDELRGVLNVESTQPRCFNESNARLLTDLASLAVIALQNATSFREAEKRRMNIETLHDVELDILRCLPDEPDEVMFSLLRRLTQMANAYVGILDLYENGEPLSTYELKVDKNGSIAETSSRGVIERGIISHVAKTRKPYITLGDALEDQYYEGPLRTHSEVAVPLVSKENDELLGVLDIQCEEVGYFTHDDLKLLEHFATHAVIAIQLWRSSVTKDLERKRFEILYLVGTQLSVVADFEQLESAVRNVADIARDAGLGNLFFHLHFPRNLASPRISPFSELRENSRSLGKEVYLRTFMLNDLSKEGLVSDSVTCSDSKAQAVIIAAVHFEDYYFGDLEFTKPERYAFSGTDLALATGLASQLALNIHRLEVTNRIKKAEERESEAEMFALMGKQAYELPHRLGNDLGIVKVHVNRAREALEQEGIRISKVTKALDEIFRGIEKVFEFSRSYMEDVTRYRDTGIFGNSPELFPIRLLLDQVIVACESGLVPHNISLVKVIEEELGDVYADSIQIDHLLTNLIKNGIEAMQDGGTLTIKARRLHAYIQIEIADTGIGIRNEDKDKVWDPFYSTKNRSGFGLFSARRTAEAHDGELFFESEIGKGTVFFLRLPVDRRS